MGRRGRKRQLGIEDEYWRLIFGGVRTVEGVPTSGHRSQDWLPLGGGRYCDVGS